MKNDNVKMGTYFVGEESFNFNFSTNPSAYRKMMFVNYVVNSLVDEDNYNSIVRDMIFDFGIVSMFTDVDTSFINKKDDEGNAINPIIIIEEFLEETNVVDIVKANMIDGLLGELNSAVDKSIAYRTGIHPNPLGEALASLVNTLEKKVNEIDLESMMGMATKFANMTEDLNVDNIAKAYMESDMHKDNLKEIAEAKADRKNSKKNEINLDENLGKAIRDIVEENKVENAQINEEN